MLPSFNLEWRHKSFSFLAAKLWNSLPTYVRNAKDISTFKCLLKKQDFRMVILNYFFFLLFSIVSRTCFNEFLSLLDVK